MNSQTTKPNYLGAFITMVILMMVIGFVTNINQQLQVPLKAAFLAQSGSLENTLAQMPNFAFFLAYLVMGSVSAGYLDRNGYKRTLTQGILIVALAFCVMLSSGLIYQHVPSVNSIQLGAATLPLSYFIFVLGSFVAGTGLTYLQASVNPYIVACDVPGTSGVTRQNIAGAGNSLMTTLGPLFVAFVIFAGQSKETIQVSSIIVPFALLIVFMALLYIIVSRLNLPDIAGTKVEQGEKLEKSIWSFSHLKLGVVAIFCYVGVEVAVGTNILFYAEELGITAEKAATLSSLYWFGMLIGRLCGSFLAKVAGQTQLMVASGVSLVLVIVSMITKQPEFLVAMGLFHSIMWGAIFALAIDKLGKYTPQGSGALMMGVVGGAILPFLQGILADALGSWELTWLLVIAGEAYMLYYALVGYKVKQLP